MGNITSDWSESEVRATLNDRVANNELVRIGDRVWERDARMFPEIGSEIGLPSVPRRNGFLAHLNRLESAGLREPLLVEIFTDQYALRVANLNTIFQMTGERCADAAFDCGSRDFTILKYTGFPVFDTDGIGGRFESLLIPSSRFMPSVKRYDLIRPEAFIADHYGPAAADQALRIDASIDILRHSLAPGRLFPMKRGYGDGSGEWAVVVEKVFADTRSRGVANVNTLPLEVLGKIPRLL